MSWLEASDSGLGDEAIRRFNLRISSARLVYSKTGFESEVSSCFSSNGACNGVCLILLDTTGSVLTCAEVWDCKPRYDKHVQVARR